MSSMTSGLGEETEVARGRGGEGGRDTASDKVEWTEASEASDLSESSEVAEGEVPRGGGLAFGRVCAEWRRCGSWFGVVVGVCGWGVWCEGGCG